MVESLPVCLAQTSPVSPFSRWDSSELLFPSVQYNLDVAEHHITQARLEWDRTGVKEGVVVLPEYALQGIINKAPVSAMKLGAHR